MADDVEDLTTEMLRRVHTKLDDIQAEMRLRFTGVETGLAALGQHLAAFHAVDAARADEIADLRRRLERVERRLELRGRRLGAIPKTLSSVRIRWRKPRVRHMRRPVAAQLDLEVAPACSQRIIRSLSPKTRPPARAMVWILVTARTCWQGANIIVVRP